MPSEILFSNNLLPRLQSYIQQYAQVVVLVDENTREHCLPKIQSILPKECVIEIKSGEEEKNLQTCTHIWEQMTAKQLDRKALMINLGGGVIGDMGGFCASTYKRGIDFIQIPTTLLSQVDASVGGKLGIDFNGLKNHIGVFKEPIAVFINDEFLSTLNSRELRSGYAEIIKHALIADKNKWTQLQSIKNLDAVEWLPLIKESVAIKEHITTTDPTEKGLRKVLNFGHTIGHAIETHYLFVPNKRLLHGEAIAIGMICEAWLAYKKGFITKDDVKEIESYILSIYPYTNIPMADVEPILSHIYQDKKNEGGKLLYSLLNKIGDSNYNIQITYEETQEALLYYVNH